MNIGLFAADTVGNEVAKFLGENREPLACLVLDFKDRKGLNSEIIGNSRIQDSNKIFYSDSLYQNSTLSALKSLEPDLILLAWWPYILKNVLIAIPKTGCLLDLVTPVKGPLGKVLWDSGNISSFDFVELFFEEPHHLSLGLIV